LQRLVADGTLGRIVAYESHFDRFRPALKPGAWRERPEPGAGVWFDLGPHLLDQAFVLFGTPRAVAADVRTERDGAAVDDAFDVTLRYANLRAVLRASMLAAAPGPGPAVDELTHRLPGAVRGAPNRCLGPQWGRADRGDHQPCGDGARKGECSGRRTQSRFSSHRVGRGRSEASFYRYDERGRAKSTML